VALNKGRPILSKWLWIAILIFIALLLTFPKWITYFYPQPHKEIVFTQAQEHGIDPYLVFAIIRAESKYEDAAESPVGAKGLMQIMPETAQWIAKQRGMGALEPDSLHDPQVNISLGCWYLADLSREFDGRLPLVIAAYNAGRGRVSEWQAAGVWDGQAETIDRIPFQETRNYVRNVLANYEAYQIIYAPDAKS